MPMYKTCPTHSKRDSIAVANHVANLSTRAIPHMRSMDSMFVWPAPSLMAMFAPTAETLKKRDTTHASNADKIILDLCGGSGSWSKPYADAGYDVRLITLPEHDVRTYEPPENVHGILAAPPCTEFSIAKSHHLDRDFESGMEVVNACLAIIKKCNPKWWALENPAGFLSKFIGEPKTSFQPWYYGDGWSKRTMLWGEFNMPHRRFYKFEDVPKIDGLYTRPGRKTPSIASMHKSHKKLIRAFDPFEADSDAAFRSITPPKFAQAFFELNP